MQNETPKKYQLTDEEAKTALAFGNAVTVAKLNVYAANVRLEQVKAEVAAACREVDVAEQRFAAAVGFLAQSHGIANWRMSPDFKQIEENK